MFAVIAVTVTAIRLNVFEHELPLLTGIEYGFSGRRVYSMHELSVLWTSQLLSRDVFMVVSLIVSLIITLAVYESVAGHSRAFAVAAASTIAGPLVAGGIFELLSLAGNGVAERAMSTVDYGISAVTAGAGGALAAVAGRRLRWFILFWLIAGSLLHHQLADAEHIVAFGLGFAISSRLPAPGDLRDRARHPWRLPLTAAAVIPTVVLGLLASNLVVDHPNFARPINVVADVATGPPSHATTTTRQSRRTNRSSAARVEVKQYPTPSIGGTQGVYVLLPAGYDDDSTKQYPVVEILHGHPGTAVDVISGLDLARVAGTAGLPAFIAIAPEAVGPIIANGYFANLQGQQLGEAVSVDLRAWVTTKYRTTNNWSVTGLSAGGYGAAYLATLHPDLYRSACPMSAELQPAPSIMTHQPIQIRDATNLMKHIVPNGPAMLLIVGDKDTPGLRDAREYFQALQTGNEPASLVIASGGHEWSMWRTEILKCLTFMLDKQMRNSPRSTSKIT